MDNVNASGIGRIVAVDDSMREAAGLLTGSNNIVSPTHNRSWYNTSTSPRGNTEQLNHDDDDDEVPPIQGLSLYSQDDVSRMSAQDGTRTDRLLDTQDGRLVLPAHFRFTCGLLTYFRSILFYK